MVTLVGTRCRRSAMYYNQFEYPLFTVMDEPEFYKGAKKAGIYFVETTNYLPMRGNVWYSLPMIMYCLENKYILNPILKTLSILV